MTLIVPFPAGGPSDQLARNLARALGKALATGVQIENIGGGGGTVGVQKAARAQPDGRTLLLHHIGMATAPALYPALPYKPLDDFEYLGLLQEVPMTLVGRPGLPAKDYAQLSAWMVANRGKVNWANAGQGSASHLCGLMFRNVTRLDLRSVRYRGASPAMADLLAGQVDLMCDMSTDTLAQIRKGRIRAYAVTSSHRLTQVPELADVPTLDELGLKGFSVTVWYGLYAPAGTPKPALERLASALQRVRADPDFIEGASVAGASVVVDVRGQGLEHKRFVKAEIIKWGAALRAAGDEAN
ncbi:tripartite tricarboxylate transporter substrate-binding protein [Paucibacter sp. hw1]|uniref:Tripartite tricarboxylate transporter substrate-binding protein n=1 Tax=Roseateles koreensis TaxID=2987526 RepID=A0ABT5KSD6_9BURK|nr:tripartite tricarboxylate transporter substrate-binding protein [Roseateles koreensis]MDC8785846.1 tripartite tricarboxylate transporter substrate-binding protein [Roseateles koreensis]